LLLNCASTTRRTGSPSWKRSFLFKIGNEFSHTESARKAGKLRSWKARRQKTENPHARSLRSLESQSSPAVGLAGSQGLDRIYRIDKICFLYATKTQRRQENFLALTYSKIMLILFILSDVFFSLRSLRLCVRHCFCFAPLAPLLLCVRILFR
jgi:hypothetical protein